MKPTKGVVEIRGQAAPLGDPREMIRLGVACIYQHSNLAPAMSVLDNIYLGRQPTNRFGFVDAKRQRRQARDLLDHGIALDLDVAVGDLATVKQKEVEIMKALALDARVILMDEPTGWLANSEVVKLHATIRALKERGVEIVYISHVLNEIFAVCDTVTIMRDGKVVAEGAVADLDRPRVVHLMVGEKLARESAEATKQKRHPRGTGEVRLKVSNLTKRGVFEDVSFDLYAGEIFCVPGLIGSKRTETGARAVRRRPFRQWRAGIGWATGDAERARQRHVARDRFRPRGSASRRPHARDDGDRESAMATLDRFHRGFILDRGRMVAAGQQAISELSIQPPDGTRAVKLMSGGNQQKVLVGKWLSRGPRSSSSMNPPSAWTLAQRPRSTRSCDASARSARRCWWSRPTWKRS